MARWEPDARGRLVRAAVELFAESGYACTTTSQIAERAGLSKMTFFRHFSEKREVLFAGQQQLIDLGRAGVVSAPAGAGPLDAVGVALDAMTSAFGDEQRDYGLRLTSIIAANAELLERSAFKRATIAAALTDALHDRGFMEPVAGLAAELGTRAFYLAYGRWVAVDNTTPFPELGRRALAELCAGLDDLVREAPAGSRT